MKKIVLTLILVCSTLSLFAQLGVGTHTPNASAALDVTANDKGFLAPRIALTGTSDVTTIATPATGLLIYNTATAGVAPSNVVPGYYFFDGVKWVKFVNTLPEVLVDFDTADPNSGSPTFTPNTPQSGDAIYVSSVNSSLWIYNGTAYVSYTAPASTPFNLANSTTDAGGNKTSSIWRSGNVGIGFNNPAVPLDVRSSEISTFVTTARFQAPNNTTAGNATLLNFGVSSTTGNSADWRYVYQANGAGSNRIDFGMSGYAAPMMSYLNNGNVGIGTTGPLTKLHIQGILATNGANANATMLRMSRPTHSGFKWGSVAQFNLGTYVDAGNNVDAKSRLDLALTNGNNETTLTTVMTWLANGRVGINNTDPNAPLVVQGATGTGALKLIAPSVASGDNWWLGFGHGTTSTDANDRARIGAEIIAGGAGRLFFTTGSSGSQTRAMFIDENQRVGIGTSAPTAQLEVATMNGLSAIIRRGGSTPQTPANIILQKTSGANPNTEGALVNGDFIGRILFSASNGTSSPTNGTDIVGYAVGTQSTTNNGGGIFFRTVPLNSVNQSIERMRIEHNGNVGIGTTAPTARLDVVGGFHLRDVAGNAGTGYGIEFNTNSTAPRIDWVFNDLYIGQFASDANDFLLRNSKQTTGGFRFSTNPTGTQVDRMVILNNGNVGINTPSPSSVLHITGVFTQDITSQDNWSNGVIIRKRGNTTSALGAVASGAEIGYHSFHGWNGTGYQRGAYVFVSAAENYTNTANGTNYSVFTAANGTQNAVERFKIMHNGNVGIGTGNPNGALTLYGNASLTLPTNVQGQTGATKELVFGKGGLFNNFAAITGVDNGQFGGGLSFIVKPTGTNDFPVNAIQAMVLDWNGNMGIGTGSPLQRLHVIGNIAASGTVSASGTVLTSDARLKSKVVGIDNGLRKIMQLNPVNYDKKIALDSTATVNENGFIAQELQKIMPELVSEGNDKDKLLSVNYMAIIPVLTKAIQEQQALIEMQQQQINELKIAVDKMNKK
jgi:hypothetical protein